MEQMPITLKKHVLKIAIRRTALNPKTMKNISAWFLTELTIKVRNSEEYEDFLLTKVPASWTRLQRGKVFIPSRIVINDNRKDVVRFAIQPLGYNKSKNLPMILYKRNKKEEKVSFEEIEKLMAVKSKDNARIQLDGIFNEDQEGHLGEFMPTWKI